MAEKKTGLLVGGSGLIGGTIVNFYKNGFSDTVEIRAPSSKKLSVRVVSDIKRYLTDIRPDFIINSAMAKLGAGAQLAYEVNYLGAVNLARAAAVLNIPYIYLSSAAVMPMGKDLVEEDTLPLSSALGHYAKSKLMTEISLQYLAKEEGLDYSCIRLAIVYGAHDHKIQGFQRMFLSIVDESMPCLFTQKNTYHSYSNSRKLPFLIHHMLENRSEFSGTTYNFADKEAIDLTTLILTIKSHLHLTRPKKIYIPLWLANFGKTGAEVLINFLRMMGLKATLPPELMFLESFYKPQTLSIKKLENSSFIDPMPNENIFTRLPEMTEYYLNRWSNENLIGTKHQRKTRHHADGETFIHNPQVILDTVQQQENWALTGLSGESR